jgi:hypothetical protein
MAKRLIRYLAAKNYHFARLYMNTVFARSSAASRDPIVVYQMGKVGSSSIVASLKALKLDRPVYHVHSLAPSGIENGKRMYKRIFQNANATDFRRAGHLFASQHLRKRMAGLRHGGCWKLVSLVRDPVATNVSGFFQIVDFYLPRFSDRYNAGLIDIDDAIQVFLTEFDHEEALTWFDVELKTTLGVDVFSKPFPKEQGYEIYRSEHAEALVLRLEDLNRCATDAFRRFLAIDDFSLRTVNAAEGKSYEAAYREFKDRIRLPSWYQQRVYGSRYVKHFYTDAEIARFQSRWTRA